MVSSRPYLLGAAFLLTAAVSLARPPISGHPIIGTWIIRVRTDCTETWQLHSDGTAFYVSGNERSMSEYEISDQPNADGYFVLSDTVTWTNGKPDCLGTKTPVGDRAVNYLFPTQTGGFMVCNRSSADACVGTLVRWPHIDPKP
jgi:hypothetical protein